MASRRRVAGALAVVFVLLVVVATVISPELGAAVVAVLPLAGIELNTLAVHLPDFAPLAQLEGLPGQIGKLMFALAAGGAIGLGLEKSWNHIKSS